MAESADAPEEEPIEVEFTSAEPIEVKQVSGGGGPGWIGLIAAGVIAALAGGGIGVVAGGTGGRYAQASEVAVDISKLEESDRSIETEIADLKNKLRDAEARLSNVMDANAATNLASAEQLTQLQSDLIALRASYLAMIGETTPAAEPPVEGDVPVEEESPAPDGEAAPETAGPIAPDTLPQPAITLAALAERLDAMETLESDDAATPRELARSVSALQERADRLEEVDIQLREALAARETLLTIMQDDVKSLEEGLTLLNTTVEAHSATLENGGLASQQTLTDLAAEIEGLRTLVNDRLSKLEGTELSADEQQLIRRADRVLALSALESAIRTGEPFTQELEALAVQLPANGRISALRRIADDGAPTVDQLRSELADLKDDVASVGIPEKRRGEWAWVDEFLGSVVTVREEGSISGETASKRLDTAISLLDAGDLAGAVTETKPIDGEQGALLKDWLDKAERRLRADSQLERLRNDVITLEDAE